MVTIKIDRTKHELPEPWVTGAEILRLSGRPDDWFAYWDDWGNDRRLRPDDKLQVIEGMRFHVAPRYING